MTLTEFLVMKTSVEHDQCESCKNKAEEGKKKEESMERARQSADHLMAMHEGIVEAAWETVKEKMAKIPADADDVDRQVEELFKETMNTAIKATSLGLIAHLLR